MKISTFFYCMGQGLKNIVRNIWYSLASVATMAACVFLCCLLYAVAANLTHMTYRMESMVGITVFFDEGMKEDEILKLGKLIGDREEVATMTYISAEEAWEKFKDEYFVDNPGLADGFAGDNPLADSASFEIYLHKVEEQPAFVGFLENLDGVRRVNYSSLTVSGLTTFRNVLVIVSLALIGILLAVSVFLIGKTVAAAIVRRKEEILIMRLIGAAKVMVRAPFVMEGLVIGLLGSVIPLVAAWYAYGEAVAYALEKLTVFSGVIAFLPVGEIFRVLVPVALIQGIGIGFFGSRVAVRRYLRV